MPLTPIHLGPALAVKAAAPRYFSFLTFGVTQVVIDSEAAFYILTSGWPVHRLLHTYLGATLVAVITVVLGRPLFGTGDQIVESSRRYRSWAHPPDPAADSTGRGGFGSADRRLQPCPSGQHLALGREAVRSLVRRQRSAAPHVCGPLGPRMRHTWVLGRRRARNSVCTPGESKIGVRPTGADAGDEVASLARGRGTFLNTTRRTA